MLCYVMSCHVMLCHVMLCYVMLRYVMYVCMYVCVYIYIYIYTYTHKGGLRLNPPPRARRGGTPGKTRRRRGRRDRLPVECLTMVNY